MKFIITLLILLITSCKTIVNECNCDDYFCNTKITIPAHTIYDTTYIILAVDPITIDTLKDTIINSTYKPDSTYICKNLLPCKIHN